jgi:hypothetical protein
MHTDLAVFREERRVTYKYMQGTIWTILPSQLFELTVSLQASVTQGIDCKPWLSSVLDCFKRNRHALTPDYSSSQPS